VPVGGDHGERLGLEDEQGAVQRVARFLVGDGEDGAADERAQGNKGNAGGRDGGELGNLRVVGARHADHLGIRSAAPDLHPVVLEQLDRDVAVGQELDVVVELARGDGAEPGFLTLTAALVRMAWSRSVAVIFRRSSSASMRKLDRIGIVVLRSTTLCVAVSSFTRSWRLTVISIAAPERPASRLPFYTWHGNPSDLEAASYALTVQQLADDRKRSRFITLIVAILEVKRAWKTGWFSELQG